MLVKAPVFFTISHLSTVNPQSTLISFSYWTAPVRESLVMELGWWHRYRRGHSSGKPSALFSLEMLILCEDEYCHGVLGDCNRASQVEHPDMGSFSIMIDLQFRYAEEALSKFLTKDSFWKKTWTSLQWVANIIDVWQDCVWKSNAYISFS